MLTPLGLACGGGGGGGDDSMLEAFSGTWHYAAILGERMPPGPGTVTVAFGTVEGNGAGGLEISRSRNVNTVVSGPTTDTGPVYHLTTSGVMTWILAPPASEPDLGGILSGDGRLGLLTSITLPSVPSAHLLVRRAGTFSASTLSGDYHTVSLAYLDPSDIGYVGTTTFDGSGAAATSGTTNRDGTHQAVTSSTSYVVTPQGDLTVTGATISLEGGILQGGDLAVIGGGTTTGQTTTLELFVRAAPSASLSTFSGTYHVCFLTDTVGGYVTWAGTLQADGAGGWTAELVGKRIGATEEADPGLEMGSYAVTPDGGLTFQYSLFPIPYEGGITADGSFAVAGGPLVGTQVPGLWIFVRM